LPFLLRDTKSHLVKRCVFCPDGWNQPRCPYGWTQVGFRCFFYNQTPMSWDSAKRHCWDLGANLASVHTYWEHQRIIQLFGNMRVWIGGSKGLKVFCQKKMLIPTCSET
uniref:C-type lectin domain-containing protein n=1 Tax=Oreochromis niloticus TaxID=8128 RepID=I3JB00_ORENI